MSKVTITKSEIESKSVQVTDAKGRVLSLREPHFLDEFRLMEAVGPELSANFTWMQVFAPLSYIYEIDGSPIVPPQSKLQAEAIIQQAGREGYAAVTKALKEHFKASEQDLDFAKN